MIFRGKDKQSPSHQCDHNFHWATYFMRSNLATYKIYLAPVIFLLRFVKKALFGDKIIRKNR
jgi:hypothetical protein